MDYLLLLSSIAAGALTLRWLRLDRPGSIKLLNAFTGAYLLCITFLHLLPELYADPSAPSVPGSGHGPSTAGVLILIGFFVQVLLDSLSRGIEHGHAHPLHGHAPIGVMVGLCLHAFVEALALGNPGSHHDPDSRRMLLWSIVIHNYPVSIALMGMLLHSGMARGPALACLGGFALMAPLGLLLSSQTGLASHSRELTAFVIGIFMHMATTILFESSDEHRFNRAKMVAIAVGTGLGILTVWMH